MQVIESNIGPRVGLHAYVRSSDPNSAFLRMAGHQYQLGHRTQTPPFCAWHAFKSVIGPKFRLPVHGGPSTSTRSSDPNSAFLRMARHQLGHRTQIPPSCAWQVIGHKFRPHQYAYVSNRSSDPTSDFIHTVGSLRLARCAQPGESTHRSIHLPYISYLSDSHTCVVCTSDQDIDPNFRTRLQRRHQRLGAHLATHSPNIRLPAHGRSSDPNSDLARHRPQLPNSPATTEPAPWCAPCNAQCQHSPSCTWQVIGPKFRPREYAYISNRSSDPTSDFIHTVGSLRLARCAQPGESTQRSIHLPYISYLSDSHTCVACTSDQDIDPNFRTRLKRPHQHLGVHLATHSANIRLPAHGRSSDPNSDLMSIPTNRIGHRTQLPTSSIP
ncbi:hypothetical protein SUGI_1221560 [Cryptomeria japonica]|uniref:Uncharacterized protein n=1 Tax=Cryptomeria japonica TaxID=3369 RepID=A0AAD3RMB1_CRYJA|nr:hypothetical protein SUGI_1221560 [Cryptomeria japonica]